MDDPGQVRRGDGIRRREGSYLSIPDSPELKFTEEFTLEAWVRPAEGSSEYEPLITKQTTGSSAQPYFLYEGSSEPDHPYGGTQANTEEESYAKAPDPLPAGTWSHVALTFSGTKAKLYVNGELVDENYACPPINGEGDLEIGGASEVASYFSGRIDDVRLYNRALNTAEIGGSRVPYSLTASAVGGKDGYYTEAVARLTYPTYGSQAQSDAPQILLSVAALGPVPDEPGMSGARASSRIVHHREYVYHECPYAPGATEATGPDGHEKVMEPVGVEERDLKLLVQEATERSPVRDCPDYENGFHWVYVVGITGYITYKSGSWIEPDGPPECYAVPAPEVGREEFENKEYEEKTGKHKEQKLVNYAPKLQEGCFNSTYYATKATNGLDVIGRWVWRPGYYIHFAGPWYEHEAACGKLDGHIPINVPDKEHEYGDTIYQKPHFYYFRSGVKHGGPKPCNWAHPQNPEVQTGLEH